MADKELSISDNNKKEEEKIFEDIIKCINEYQSFVFDAGAGSGKTYSLIQTLKYIIYSNGERLKRNNQKILCITFTNVAVSEIKERLGNTSLIEVATIHECVWEIIKPYQEQLVKIHYNKLLKEISKIEKDLKTEDWALSFSNLSIDEKENFCVIINQNKDIYYKYKNENANNFRIGLNTISDLYPVVFRNVTNTKRIIDRIIKLQKFKNTITKIDNKGKLFKSVKYDARFNDDKLEIMKISHDTLLEYTEKIVCDNDLLKQFISDMFPCVLVDEYQDTNKSIIKTLSVIDEYAKKIKHHFLVGYYGDIKQNIYNYGIGNEIYNIHKDLKRIKKPFNRRSCVEVINIANKVRNDDLEQKSIYVDFPNGDVGFYTIGNSREDIISIHIDKWKINENNKLHCFELTNELVAVRSGFENIYRFFENSEWYNIGKRFELLREHLLSSDIKKLGSVQNLVFRILDFRFKINQKETMILDIICENVTNNMNILDLRKLITKLSILNIQTLKQYIECLFLKYKKNDNNYDKCLEYIIGEDIKSYNDFEKYILDQLYFFEPNKEQTEDYIQTSKTNVSEFLNLDFNEFELWYNFITNNTKDNVVFHTYHGTKGLEYKNVIIFINSNFGRDNHYFSRLFENILISDITDELISNKVNEARNLLYVAVTRAKLNLSIIYFDNIERYKEQVEKVFGTIKYEL